MVRAQKNRKTRKANVKYVLDCSTPLDDNLFDLGSLERFLLEKIKVNGKTGNLTDKVTVTRDTKSRIAVQSNVAMPKHYMKYLVRKYLKKQQLRDFLRVVSTNKSTYTLRYYDLPDAEE